MVHVEVHVTPDKVAKVLLEPSVAKLKGSMATWNSSIVSIARLSTGCAVEVCGEAKLKIAKLNDSVSDTTTASNGACVNWDKIRAVIRVLRGEGWVLHRPDVAEAGIHRGAALTRRRR